MRSWKRWITHPQTLAFRQVLYRIHKWGGLTLALYLFAMAVTGGLLVFYPALYNLFQPHRQSQAVGKALSRQELKEAAQRTYPNAQILWIWEPAVSDALAEVWISSGAEELKRAFDPITGEDLGPSVPAAIRWLNAARQFHRDLGLGALGRMVQIAASLIVVAIAFSGAIVWWPGISRWLRHIRIRRRIVTVRGIWETHSAVGFWTLPVTLVVSITGVFLALDDQAFIGEALGRSMYRLHSGSFLPGYPVNWIWGGIAFSLPILIVSGVLISWNRTFTSPVRRPQTDRTPASLSRQPS